jgi:hypothetical protein
MPKTGDEVLQGLLSTSLKLDDEGVAALKEADGSWKDDAIDVLLARDAERVETLRKDSDSKLEERYGRGKREAMEAFEKQFRDEFKVKATDKRGIDLVKAAVADLVKATGGLDEDKVKTHPLYQKLEEELQNAPTTLAERLKAREEELRSEFKRERQKDLIWEHSQAVLMEMQPHLPDDPVVARNQLSLLRRYVDEHQFEVVEGDELSITPLKKDGSGRLEDKHGHAVKYKQFIQDAAKQFYTFKAPGGGGGAPDPNRIGGGGSGQKTSGDAKLASMTDYAREWDRINKEAGSNSEKVAQWRELKERGKEAGLSV